MDYSVSVVVPVKSCDAAFQKCIKRIESCSPPAKEVLIVIDGCPNDTLKGFERHPFQIIRLSESGGPARARNIGAEQASGDILLFVDADVIVPTNIIEKIRNAFLSENRPDAVFGSYDNNPPEKDSVSLYKNLLHHYTHQHAAGNAFTFWTGCGAVLRNRFLNLKGFSVKYTLPSIEDIELGYRMKTAGYTILLDKTIQVTHLKKWSLSSLVKTDLFLRAVPWSKLILQYGSMNNDMNINMTNRLSVLLCLSFLFFTVCSFINATFAYAAILSLVFLLWLNRRIFTFFYRQNGALFMFKAIILHFLYYLMSGLGFFIAYLDHLSRSMFRSKHDTNPPEH